MAIVVRSWRSSRVPKRKENQTKWHDVTRCLNFKNDAVSLVKAVAIQCN